MKKNKIKELVFMSKDIGYDPACTQAGGGNTSVKLDDCQMAIKSSGRVLKEMTENDGYSIVDYKKIRDYLRSSDQNEYTFLQKLKSCTVEGYTRPSMETGFHALLGDYVIHTHSVYANLLTCSKEGKDIASKLFKKALWLDYVTPGYELTLAIKETVQENYLDEGIIFLKNHGIIVVSQTAQEALNLHKDVHTKIQSYFNLSTNAFKFEDTKVLDSDLTRDQVLFPDQVVYALDDVKTLKTNSEKEILVAYNFVLQILKEKDLTPNFLSKENIEVLLNMESEKYRQKIALT